MHPKEMKFDQDVRQSLMEGALLVAAAVGSTLGPKGKLVMMDRHPETPKVTKDGVSVANEIFLADPYANMGNLIVRQAAKQTADEAGDGTTTATILAAELIQSGTKILAAGASSPTLIAGIEEARDAVIEFYNTRKRDIKNVDEVKMVGTCAANQDEVIGGMISDAMDKVGKDGVVIVEKGQSPFTEMELVEGVQFDRGLMSPYMANERGGTAELIDPLIVITEEKLTEPTSVLCLLKMALVKKRPVLVICEDCTGTALHTILLNKKHSGGACHVVPVKKPFWGDTAREVLVDLAVMTNGTVMSPDTEERLSNLASNQEAEMLQNVEYLFKMAGEAKKVVVTPQNTTIFEGLGEEAKIEERCQVIREQADKPETSSYDREKLNQRLARLTGGLARITVGAPTEAETDELKDRVEDALYACKAAIEEGVIPGGTVTPFYAALQLEEKLRTEWANFSPDKRAGVQAVMEALKSLFKVLSRNAARDPGEITFLLKQAAAKKDYNFGWNVATDETGDLTEMGVIVPTKVERMALINAVSAAKMVLGTSVLITDLKMHDSPKDEPQP